MVIVRVREQQRINSIDSLRAKKRENDAPPGLIVSSNPSGINNNNMSARRLYHCRISLPDIQESYSQVPVWSGNMEPDRAGRYPNGKRGKRGKRGSPRFQSCYAG